MNKIHLIIFLCLTHYLFGQTETSLTAKPKINSEYLIDYSDQLSIKFFGVLKSNSIRHYDNFTKRFVDYKPNENFNIGLGVGHKWLGIDLAFSFPFINNDDVIFGSTKRFDIQINMYLRKFSIDFNFQRYKGYYGSNPGSYLDGFDPLNPVYPIRPDISSSNTAINALYIFKSHKFSYRAAFIYNERQIKSAGSWLAGAYLSHFKMNADSTVVPIQLRSEFNPEADFRNTNYINMGISGGYGHTFIIAKKFFFSLTIALGVGPAFIAHPENAPLSSGTDVKLAVRGIGRTAIGYNAETFYAGISGVSSNSSEIDENDSYLARGVSNFKIFVGKRFNPPKLFSKN